MYTVNDYAGRRSYADAYLNQQIEIISTYLSCLPKDIRLSTFEEDVTEATDFVGPNDIKIGGRVRKYSQSKYVGQFTIRTSKGRDGLSELDKILLGKSQLMLYGFADETETKIDKWWLLDLAVVAQMHKEDYPLGTDPYETTRQDCSFNAYTISNLPARLILSTNQQIEPNQYERLYKRLQLRRSAAA